MTLKLARTVAICALTLAFAAPAVADPGPKLAPTISSKPAIGLGLSFSFGQGKVDTGIGIRVFSGNLRNKTVATVGIDYMLSSQRWRGTLGVARLGNKNYVGLDLGIGLRDGAFDFGVAAGALNTRNRVATLPDPS
jgi:hypothetical protein